MRVHRPHGGSFFFNFIKQWISVFRTCSLQLTIAMLGPYVLFFKTLQFQITWLLAKPSDQDLHYFPFCLKIHVHACCCGAADKQGQRCGKMKCIKMFIMTEIAVLLGIQSPAEQLQSTWLTNKCMMFLLTQKRTYNKNQLTVICTLKFC